MENSTQSEPVHSRGGSSFHAHDCTTDLYRTVDGTRHLNLDSCFLESFAVKKMSYKIQKLVHFARLSCRNMAKLAKLLKILLMICELLYDRGHKVRQNLTSFRKLVALVWIHPWSVIHINA